MQHGTPLHLFVSTLLFAGCVGVYVFFGYQVFSLKRETALLSEERLRSQGIGEVAPPSSEYVALCQKLSEHFVSAENPTPLLELLESVGRVTGTTLVVKNVSDGMISKGKQDVSDIRITLTIEGTWEGVVRTISFLEKVPYTHTLENVLLVRAEKNDVWTAEIIILFDVLP